MTEAVPIERTPWAIPPGALPEWLRLATLVDEIDAVPCRTSDPEAWWPDRKEVDDFPARMALDACTVCAAQDACLDYAVAADEREGIWGGLTPAERLDLRRELGTPAAVADRRPEHGEERTYTAGCSCSLCRRAHAKRIADWRTRRRYAETTRVA